MSRIVVLADFVGQPVPVLRALRQVTGAGLAELKSRVELKRPVAEYVLFQNDHEAVAGALTRLMEDVPRAGGRLRLFELEPSTSFLGIEEDARKEISVEVLRNILKAHGEEIERQYGPSGTEGR